MRSALLAFLVGTAFVFATVWLASPSLASLTKDSGNQARYVLPPPSADSAPFPDCPKIGVIGSRGSGENLSSSEWDDGLGPPPQAFALALGKLVRGVEYTSNAPPGYPAVTAHTVVTNKHAYINSVQDGEAQLLRMLVAERVKCSSTKLILVGYSQGAELTGDAYLVAIHRKDVFDRIAGVVLFGDPLYNHSDAADMQTALQKKTQSGLTRNGALAEVVAPWHIAPAHSFPGSTVGRVLSYCLIDDYVCQGVGGNPFSHQHSHYPQSGDPQDAAQWFAKRVVAAPSGSSPVPVLTAPTATSTQPSTQPPSTTSGTIEIANGSSHLTVTIDMGKVAHWSPGLKNGAYTLGGCDSGQTTSVVPITVTFAWRGANPGDVDFTVGLASQSSSSPYAVGWDVAAQGQPQNCLSLAENPGQGVDIVTTGPGIAPPTMQGFLVLQNYYGSPRSALRLFVTPDPGTVSSAKGFIQISGHYALKIPGGN